MLRHVLNAKLPHLENFSVFWISVRLNVLCSEVSEYVPFMWYLHCLVRENFGKHVTHCYKELCFLAPFSI
jgi:hypothetical protein